MSDEVGGDFEWVDFPDEESFNWVDRRLWFARGRDAVVALFQRLPSSDRGRLFLPTYFCQDVAASFRRAGIETLLYEDSPELKRPEFVHDTPTGRDFVHIVNYFGLQDRSEFCRDVQQTYNAGVIEDHTHDPFSEWARSSSADYCYASMRKTLPVSDGAILWSPLDRAMPELIDDDVVFFDPSLVAAMILKRTYLNSTPPASELKAAFRTLQMRHNDVCEKETGIFRASPWSRWQLNRGVPRSWRRRREANCRILIDALSDRWPQMILTREWAEGSCPFTFVIRFPTNQIRDRIRARLIAARIYPPVHWQIESVVSQRAAELGSTVLSIPIDQRYEDADMLRVADRLSLAIAAETGGA